MKKILIFYLLSITTAFCQTVPDLTLFWHYSNIEEKDRPKIIIVVEKIVEDQIGRIRLMPDSSLEIAITNDFYNYYGDGSSEIKRLVYQLMGYQYHMKTRKCLMRPGSAYLKITDNKIKRTFKKEEKLNRKMRNKLTKLKGKRRR